MFVIASFHATNPHVSPKGVIDPVSGRGGGRGAQVLESIMQRKRI